MTLFFSHTLAGLSPGCAFCYIDQCGIIFNSQGDIGGRFNGVRRYTAHFTWCEFSRGNRIYLYKAVCFPIRDQTKKLPGLFTFVVLFAWSNIVKQKNCQGYTGNCTQSLTCDFTTLCYYLKKALG